MDGIRPVPGFPGFSATFDGRIIGIRGYPLRPHGKHTRNDKVRYYVVHLRDEDGKYRTVTWHRAISSAWLGFVLRVIWLIIRMGILLIIM